jgi:hypothetical protein
VIVAGYHISLLSDARASAFGGSLYGNRPLDFALTHRHGKSGLNQSDCLIAREVALVAGAERELRPRQTNRHTNEH